MRYLISLLALSLAACSWATIDFTFEEAGIATGNSFEFSSNGLTVTFWGGSGDGVPCPISITSTECPWNPAPLTWGKNCLEMKGKAVDRLFIDFSKPISYAQLEIGTANPDVNVDLGMGGWVFEQKEPASPYAPVIGWTRFYAAQGQFATVVAPQQESFGRLIIMAKPSENDFRIDNLRVIPVTTVPEPGVLASIAPGLLLFGSRLRRRKKS